MATKKSQRIGIVIIMLVMVVGTIGSFVAMILGSHNAKIDLAAQQKQQAEVQKLFSEYQATVAERDKQLSDKYYAQLVEHSSRVSAFDPATLTSLQLVDLTIGDGEVVTDQTKYSAYYIGWNPKGKIFDQSIDGNKLKSPLPSGGMIDGWNEGVVGMKLGGVREIAVPSDKAYKDAGQGDDIPPNTPIKFLVLLIPVVEEVPVPQKLLEAYGS